jgi:ankyrin repeat protein
MILALFPHRSKVSRWLSMATLLIQPLVASCDMITSDPQEFKLNTTTVSDVFGHFSLRDLARAAAAGQVDQVATLVKKGVNPNGRGEEGITPLFWALFAGNEAGMAALLKAGADPNLPMHMKNKDGEWDEYLLVSVAEARQLNLLKLLLDNGADPENVSSRDTALTISAGCLECIKMLVAHGANVNRKVGGSTVAELASAIRHYDAVIYLLEHGYTFELDKLAWDVKDQETFSPEVQKKQEKIVKMITDQGITPFVP